MMMSNNDFMVNPVRMIKSTSSTSLISSKTIKENNRIHSGHFMVSEIDENDDNETKIENDNNNNNNDDGSIINNNNNNNIVNVRPNMETLEQKTTTEKTQTYRIRKSTTTKIVSIDQTLWKLFQCMTLAYNDDITSPKWKSFKGLKMNIKDKIRLNNIIWRAWHIQCN